MSSLQLLHNLREPRPLVLGFPKVLKWVRSAAGVICEIHGGLR
ncbi:hypothetical protein [Piscinibacter koreensis]|nr:hypothetical protein [Schlegelella koreensis]